MNDLGKWALVCLCILAAICGLVAIILSAMTNDNQLRLACTHAGGVYSTSAGSCVFSRLVSVDADTTTTEPAAQ